MLTACRDTAADSQVASTSATLGALALARQWPSSRRHDPKLSWRCSRRAVAGAPPRRPPRVGPPGARWRQLLERHDRREHDRRDGARKGAITSS